jgi:predicted nucleotidyltransferase
MRLNDQQIAAIKHLLHGEDPRGEIRLYGSRVDDQRRGGDVDLYFQPTTHWDYRKQLLLQYRLQCALDIKVDLLVFNPSAEESPIIHIAKNGILL